MSAVSHKEFILKLLNGTEFTLNLREASQFVGAYKWFYDLPLEKAAPIAKENPIKKVTKKKGK